MIMGLVERLTADLHFAVLVKLTRVAFVFLLDRLKELIGSVAHPRRFLDRGVLLLLAAWGLHEHSAIHDQRISTIKATT